MLRRSHLSLLLGLTLVAGAGCGETPTGARAGVGASASENATATLLQCSAAQGGSATSVIGALGGVLSVGGTSVVIPVNAVLAPTSFTLTVPSSPYVEIEVTAGGAGHYVFSEPVVVSIDYGRCGGSLLSPPHEAWNIDPDTKELLEKMIGVDVKLTHTVVFTTIHFSGYALAD